jgi:hypothetical protein
MFARNLREKVKRSLFRNLREKVKRSLFRNLREMRDCADTPPTSSACVGRSEP